MTWEIKIDKIENGFIVTHNAEASDNIVKTIFEYNESIEHDELRCMEKLLWFIKDHFGIYYAKHDKKNINIEIEDTNK